MERKCLCCGKIYRKSKKYSKTQWENSKNCSPSCAQKTHPGSPSGNKNPNWKGEKVGYGGMHEWVAKCKGKPKKCELCGTRKKRRYNWANKDHKYRRKIKDYIRLCVPCHRKYDYSRIKFETTCIICNKKFYSKVSYSKYCSFSCKWRMAYIKKESKVQLKYSPDSQTFPSAFGCSIFGLDRKL